MQIVQDEDELCILTRNSRVEEEGSVVLSPRDNEPVVADGQAEAVLGVRLQGKSRIVNDLHVHSIAEIGLMSLWNSRKKEILIVGVWKWILTLYKT